MVTEQAIPDPAPDRVVNRNTLFLWQGRFLSSLVIMSNSAVMVLWIKQATDAASAMGLLSLLIGIPSIVLGMVGGTFADRYPRRLVITLMDAASGLLLLAMGILFFTAPGSVSLLLAVVIAVSVFASVASTFSSPATSAAMPDLVPREKIRKANMIGQMIANISQFLAVGLAGIVFRVLGAPVVAVAGGVLLLYASFSESMARIPDRRVRNEAGQLQRLRFKEDLKEGFATVWHSPSLRSMILVAPLLGFFMAPVILLIPYYVLNHLGMPYDWVGFIGVSYSLGAFGGFIVGGTAAVRGRQASRLLVLLMLVHAFGPWALALVHVPALALVLFFVGGLCSGYITVHITSILQITTPAAKRGRVFGVLNTIASSLAPIGAGFGGIIFDAIGQNIPAMYIGCASAAVVCIAVVSWNPEFRTFLAFEQPRNN